MNECINCGQETNESLVLCDNCLYETLENPEMWDDWTGSDWQKHQTDAPKDDWLEGRSQLHKPF